MRRAIALAVMLASACSPSAGGGGDASTGGSAGTAGAPESVPCALGGAREYKQRCGVERAQVDGKTVVTLRHPDGGFRRLIELGGGKGYAAADGSDEAHSEANGREIEVTLGDDHYLMPAPATASARPE